MDKKLQDVVFSLDAETQILYNRYRTKKRGESLRGKTKKKEGSGEMSSTPVIKNIKKRNGEVVPFDASKISNAIQKANLEST
ncbi:MAG: hypothetical protein J6N99_04775, partial [Schwartzia sp.]|nr:hypothetical protein [Schwartzia sp. (in: firmicutes)]